ncbi:MAG: hypothetical protein H6728_00635 [Myxococcales bacterium]|nr:hypothetical protein [Myxococcales bacterium]MCB9641570.1 hypothetical protein [Myxococcales bacterium]
MRIRFLTGMGLMVVGLWLFGVACGAPKVSPITLTLQYRPTASSFVAASGWKIDLEQAQVSFQAFRLYEGTPAYSLRTLPRWGLRHLADSLVGTAWAHPGHFEGGSVKAEWIAAKPLDLLGTGDQEVGKMDAFTGDYGAAEFTFEATDLATLRGTASKDGVEVKFACEIALEKRSLSGLAFEHAISSGEKPVTFSVQLAHWFELTDFSAFSQDEKVPSRKRPDETQTNILRKAVLQSTSYSLFY